MSAEPNTVTASMLVQANEEIHLGWKSQVRLDCVKLLYTKGESASQIANKIGGISRNAVIGILHRKNWAVDRRQTKLRAPKRIRTLRVPKAQPKQPPSAKIFTFGAGPLRALYDGVVDVFTPAVEELVIPMAERKYITTLTNACCRWPIGDPQHADFHFCGKGKVTGLPYCEFHARRAFQPPNQSRRGQRDYGGAPGSHMMSNVTEFLGTAEHAVGLAGNAAGGQNASWGGEGGQQKKAASGELVGAK